MVIEGVLFNGQPLVVESDKCDHDSPLCNGQRVSSDGEILVSKLGRVCDFHYDVIFTYYEYVDGSHITLEEFIANAER